MCGLVGVASRPLTVILLLVRPSYVLVGACEDPVLAVVVADESVTPVWGGLLHEIVWQVAAACGDSGDRPPVKHCSEDLFLVR